MIPAVIVWTVVVFSVVEDVVVIVVGNVDVVTGLVVVVDPKPDITGLAMVVDRSAVYSLTFGTSGIGDNLGTLPNPILCTTFPPVVVVTRLLLVEAVRVAETVTAG